MEQTTAAVQQVAESTSTLDMAMRIILALVTIIGGGGGLGLAKVIWTLKAKVDSLQEELKEFKTNTRASQTKLFDDVGAIATDNALHREQMLKEKNEALEKELAALRAAAGENKK